MSTTVQVTLNGNGGTAPAEPKTVVVGGKYGFLPTPVREGFAFYSWASDSQGGVLIGSETTVTKTTDHSIYALWVAPETATITFDAHGGSGEPDPIEFSTGDFVVIPDVKPTRLHMISIFAGWSADPDAKKVEYFPGKAYQFPESTVLYAAWRTQLYGVAYSGNTVEQFRTVFSAQYATAQGLPDGVLLIPSLFPYIYCVSCCTTESNPTYYNPYAVLSVAVDTSGQFQSLLCTMTGQIGEATPTIAETARQFLVTQPYTGSQVAGPALRDITLAVDTEALDADGYEFEGWFHTEAGGTIPDGYSTGTNAKLRYGEHLTTQVTYFMPASGHHMIAPLVRKKKYICVFDPQGGTVSPSFKYVVWGEPYGELPVPTLSRYAFVGWFTEAEGGVQVLSTTLFDDDLFDSKEDHVLYAHWTANGMARVLTFNWANGDEIIEEDGIGVYVPNTITTKSITVGAAYGTLPVPSRTGYRFSGWFLSTVGSSQITAATVAGDEDLTVFAHWIPSTVIITFNANGGSVSEQSRAVPYGEQYLTLPVPEYAGRSFDGWFTAQTGGTLVSAATVARESRTLWAHWSNGAIPWGYVQFAIHLVKYGGVLAASYGELKYTVGYAKTLPTWEEMSKSGYWFEGWYDNPDFTGSPVVAIPSTATGSKTFYAHWL